jgi:hypothetical protein
MARTNSPEFNTYKTVDIKFNAESTYRSGDLTVQRDANIINMYYDRISQENKQRFTQVKKRPGITTSSYSLTKVTSSNTIRGNFNDVNQNTFYWVVGTKVYSVSPDVGTTVRTVTTLSTSSGLVGFCTFLKSNGTRYVLISDGTDLWIDDYVAVSCTKVVDVDMPTPHEPCPLYLDGYVFLIKHNTGDIYNSDLDTPTSWNISGVVSAEINADYALKLYKVKNYIICLGSNSIEYFWDAANTAPSSPLSRQDSPFRGVGYITNGHQIGDTVYFVGQDHNQNVSVYAVNSFKVDRISNSVVDRTLQTFSSTSNSKSNVNLSKNGFSISSDGHTFYVVPTTQTTWVYEVDDHIWYEWKGSDATGLAIEGSWGMYNGANYLAVANQDYISVMSPTVYQDFGSNFTCRYTTENMLFDTFNWKIGHRLALDCSMHASTGTSNLTLYYSVDDWSPTGVVGTRTINVFSSSPCAFRLGKFRNISFRFEYADNYPFFMAGATMDVNVYGV